MTRPTRTVVPYFGGKWKIADWIISHFPEHRVYTECFGGAASVLMRKLPSKVEVYNDLSSEMVNLFRVLRDPRRSVQLIDQLNLTPYSREEWQNCHKRTRNTVEQARRTVVLFMLSSNAGKAMMRHRNGFKSHSSDHTHAASFRRHTESLKLITERLQHVIIEHRHAKLVIKQHDYEDSLHYVDPPYLGKTRKGVRTQYLHEMTTIEEHQDLVQFLHELKGYVFLSGYRSEEYNRWMTDRGWYSISTKQTDGSSEKGKSSRMEVLWMNPKAAGKYNNLFNQQL